MEKEKIARINALAHKAKTSGLTEAELAERDALRQEYLADIRASVIDQLEHTTVIEPDGTRRKLQTPCSKWRPGRRGAVWFAQNCAGVLEFASGFAII